MRNSFFRAKISRDILYGDVKIPRSFLNCIVDTHQFQLLDWRKQLGTAHLIYRNAHHTRFEHSLGVYELSKRFSNIVRLKERRVYFPIETGHGVELASETTEGQMSIMEQPKLLWIASLIHDIGNYPFCHQLERSSILQMPNHEQIGSMIIRQKFSQISFLTESELKELGILNKREILANIINTKAKSNLLPEYSFLRELISGPYGLDFLDYVYRDSFYCGFSTRSVADFLLDHAIILFDVEAGLYKLGFTQHVVHELASLAYLRLDLERKVYSNKTHKTVTEMLARAIHSAIEEARLNVNELCMYTDDGLLAELENFSGRDSRKFVELIRSRKLYDVIYRFDAMKPKTNSTVRHALRIFGMEQVEELRERIHKGLEDKGVDEEDILLSFPHPGDRTCKEGEALVLLESGDVRQLNEIDPWVIRYEQEYENLRKYLVLLSEDASVYIGDVAERTLMNNFERWVLEIYGVQKFSPQSIKDRLGALSEMQAKILGALLDKRLAADEIGKKVDRSRPTVHYHLKRLLQKELVEREKRGRKIKYTVAPEVVPHISDKSNI